MTDFLVVTASLTKLIINPLHPSARRALSDVHLMHQITTKLACPADFGPASRSAAGLLYRVEQTSAGIAVLIQSRTAIDPERLPPGYAYSGTRGLDSLLNRLNAGTLVRYRILANATKRGKAATPGLRGDLRPLVGQDALDWWDRKAADAGLRIETADISQTVKLNGARAEGKQRIVVTASQFEGCATVVSADATRNAILNGIGRGRAYGCGLLSLALL